jgi:Glycosyl hydrolases family 38 N-terminal domain
VTGAPQAPQPRRASYVLHVASVAGLDREGFAPFPVAQLELVRMLDDVLDLFDNEPRFHHFTLDGQSILLEDYLSIRPENFERIEQAVQDGKLLVGPWYVQTEPLYASAESLIRNLMIGLRTARVFGRPMLVGYLPHIDVLPGYVPQILKAFGINSVIASPGIYNQPIEMAWEGDDGTHIVLSDLRQEAVLDSGKSIPEARRKLAPFSESGHLLLLRLRAVNAPHQQRLAFFEPLTAAQVELHDDVFSSNPAAYAQAVEAYARANSLPVVYGDLGSDALSEDAGECSIKSRNAEALLTQVIEPFSVWSEKQQSPDHFISRPQAFIQKLWRDMLAGVQFDRIDNFAAHLRQIRPDTGQDSFIPGLIVASDPAFHISAVKLPEDADRSGMIVRGWNVGEEPLWVTLTPWRPFATVDVVTLDEAPTGGKLATESNGAVRFKAAPHRILTFWFHD